MYQDTEFTERFARTIEAVAEDFIFQYDDPDEAFSAVMALRESDAKWRRRIDIYMEIEFISNMQGLKSAIRDRFKENDDEAAAVWGDFFPNRDDDSDEMEDWLTDEE